MIGLYLLGSPYFSFSLGKIIILTQYCSNSHALLNISTFGFSLDVKPSLQQKPGAGIPWWLGLHAATTKGSGSVPDQETKIPQGTQPSQINKK